MRCREAGQREWERQLGLLDPALEPVLDRHLDGCAACAARARGERELTAGLVALREDVPFAVDVTDRVLRDVAAIGRRPADEVPTGHLGWAAAAAMACGVLLVMFTWTLAPDLLRSAREGWAAAAGLSLAWERTVGALGSLSSVAWDLARRFAAGLAGMLSGGSGLYAAAAVTVTACSAAMMLTILLVVKRDFARIVQREVR